MRLRIAIGTLAGFCDYGRPSLTSWWLVSSQRFAAKVVISSSLIGAGISLGEGVSFGHAPIAVGVIKWTCS